MDRVRFHEGDRVTVMRSDMPSLIGLSGTVIRYDRGDLKPGVTYRLPVTVHLDDGRRSYFEPQDLVHEAAR
jgi:hypothetical protein